MSNNNSHKLPGHVMQLIEAEARKIITEVSGIKSVVLATPDGFDIASAMAEEGDPEKIAAMASSIIAISNVVAQEAGLASGGTVTINTRTGFILLQGAKYEQSDLLINIVGNQQAVLALAAYRAAKLSDQISRL